MNLKYAIAGLALLMGSAGIVVFVNGRRGHEGENSSNVITGIKKPFPGRQAGGKKSAVSVRGAKRPDMVSGRNRRRERLVEVVDDDRDDLPPEDRRLLSAIEEGMDDDSLEKVLKVLPEASASTNAEIRSELVDALDGFGVPAMNHLLPFLADPDDDVRQSAIDSWTSSLGEGEDEKMKARLITAVLQGSEKESSTTFTVHVVDSQASVTDETIMSLDCRNEVLFSNHL